MNEEQYELLSKFPKDKSYLSHQQLEDIAGGNRDFDGLINIYNTLFNPGLIEGNIATVGLRITDKGLKSLSDDESANSSVMIEGVKELVNNHIAIESYRNALVTEPTYRNILYLISKYPNLFCNSHFIEILRIHTSDREKYKQLGETIRMVEELKVKGYIKYDLFKGNTVFFNGKLYRLYTHPSLTFWGIVLAVLAIILTLVLAVR